MNTAIAIMSAAFASLYIQLLSVIVILFVYHSLSDADLPLMILLLRWVSCCLPGSPECRWVWSFWPLKPWYPGFVGIATTVYSRANMIASGKMFVANTLPPAMLAMFDWNPLFHCIDQMRGVVFINY